MKANLHEKFEKACQMWGTIYLESSKCLRQYIMDIVCISCSIDFIQFGIIEENMFSPDFETDSIER